MKDQFLGIDMTFVETHEEANEFVEWISTPREFLGVDAEFAGLVFHRHPVRMVQFGDFNSGFAIPVEGPNSWAGLVQHAFDHYPGDRFAFHGITMDVSRLEHHGFKLPAWSRLFDTHIGSFLHNNQEASRKLKMLALKYVGVDSRQGELDLNKLFRQRSWFWDTVPLNNPVYVRYSILDPVLTARLAHILSPHIKPYGRAWDLEMASARVLTQLMQRGVEIDIKYARQEANKLHAERDQLMYQDLTGDWRLREGDIRPNFKNDIMDWFDAINVQVPVKTSRKTGAFTIDNDVLERVDHPMAATILRVMKIKTHLDQYFDSVIRNEMDGRVYPSLNPCGSDDTGLSGRIGMRDPNLIMLENNSYIRDMVIAKPGHKLISIDYSNQEMRMFASVSQCIGLIDAFARGEDVYKAAAAKLYHMEPSAVTDVQKGRGKRGMLTWMHGGQAKTFAKYLLEGGDFHGDTGQAMEEAIRYYDWLRNVYPEVEQKQRDVAKDLKQTKHDNYGHVILGDGRRLFVLSNKPQQAISFLGMGESVIVMKEALVQLDIAGLSKYMLTPLHDEILFEVPKEHVNEFISAAVPIMERYDYTVPLTVEVGVYDRWGDQYREKVVE